MSESDKQRLEVAEQLLKEIAEADVSTPKDTSDDQWCYLPWWLHDRVEAFASGRKHWASGVPVPGRETALHEMSNDQLREKMTSEGWLFDERRGQWLDPEDVGDKPPYGYYAEDDAFQLFIARRLQ